MTNQSGPEVLFADIAIDVPQARFWIASVLPTFCPDFHLRWLPMGSRADPGLYTLCQSDIERTWRTTMSTAYVLLRGGFADWEPASALAELRRTFGFSVKAIGLTSETVVSMGGLKVIEQEK